MKRIIVFWVILIVVVAAGVLFWKKPELRFWERSSKQQTENTNNFYSEIQNPAGDAVYVNFDGRYFFPIPALYTVNDSAIDNIQLVYSSTDQFGELSIGELYDKGVIAVQPMRGADSEESFKKYIEKNIISDTDKSLGTKSKAEYSSSQDGLVALVKSQKNDQVVRIQQLINMPYSALVAAKSNNAAFETVKNIRPIEKITAKDDIEKMNLALQQVLINLKTGKVDEVMNAGSKNFHETSDKSEIEKMIDGSKKILSRIVNISGGTYVPDRFVAHIMFIDKDNKEKQIINGSAAMIKEDGSWKLDTLSIPSDQSL